MHCIINRKTLPKILIFFVLRTFSNNTNNTVYYRVLLFLFLLYCVGGHVWLSAEMFPFGMLFDLLQHIVEERVLIRLTKIKRQCRFRSAFAKFDTFWLRTCILLFKVYDSTLASEILLGLIWYNFFFEIGINSFLLSPIFVYRLHRISSKPRSYYNIIILLKTKPSATLNLMQT